MNEKQIKTISKFLSLILRHNPEKINLTLDKNGWANVDELILKSKSKVKFDLNILNHTIVNHYLL